MHTEVKTWRTRRSFIDKLRGWKVAYETKMAEGHREVVGRGPTPEASQEAAQRRWDAGKPTADDTVHPEHE